MCAHIHTCIHIWTGFLTQGIGGEMREPWGSFPVQFLPRTLQTEPQCLWRCNRSPKQVSGAAGGQPDFLESDSSRKTGWRRETVAGHGGTQEGGGGDWTGEKQPSLPPLPHFPESPRAEATCHHIFSYSAKLCLGEVKDKSPEVCEFDSHLTRLLSTARGSTAVQISSSRLRLSLQLYSCFACLIVGPCGRVSMMQCQPSLLGMTQHFGKIETQGRALS